MEGAVVMFDSAPSESSSLEWPENMSTSQRPSVYGAEILSIDLDVSLCDL